jgi:hypothetical protein
MLFLPRDLLSQRLLKDWEFNMVLKLKEDMFSVSIYDNIVMNGTHTNHELFMRIGTIIP